MAKLFIVFVSFSLLCQNSFCLVNKNMPPTLMLQVKQCVKEWSKQLGNDLYTLSSTMTRKRKIQENFSKIADQIHDKSEDELLRTITDKLNDTLQKKMHAVTRIAEYAEFLAYHRNTETIWPSDNYYFYNADNITNTSLDCGKEAELETEIQEAKCVWWCEQKDLPEKKPLKNNSFSKAKAIEDLFHAPCDCKKRVIRLRPEENYNFLPMKKHRNFGDTPVNLNLSVVKVAANIHEREQEVLQGTRWSEPLDMIFRQNQEYDNTLKYQYFASPHGYMRHFPAVKWSDERYAQTYDPRTRSWYTEAMTSPKDIFILLDFSGSVIEKKRNIAAHIINNILDTLNDNDFVNVYLFSNSTRPLVPCFEDTLVQANEENLRLLRETLDNYDPIYQANISLGLTKAFTLLEKFRENRVGSQCNQAIMLITEGAFLDNQAKFFQYHNWQHKTPVRVFSYQLERSESDATLLEWIACSNKGYFVNVSLMQEVREKALPYINVMSRPINLDNKDRPRRELIWSSVYIDLADRRYTNWLWKKLEGLRQRAIFLDHAKREFTRLHKVLISESHFLLQESHEYEKYENRMEYDYLTTLSLPVYGRREGDVEIIGVAGLDVPIKLLNSLIPHHTIGVNGYAFIITNNGYILMHPQHRREFENIPKPTFNRVDLLEVEIMDDSSEPRLFNKSIVKLREQIVHNIKEPAELNVKFALDGMKRIILSRRKYVHVTLGDAFRVGVALPKAYGLMTVNVRALYDSKSLRSSKNWAVHPDWVYCNENDEQNPEKAVLSCIRRGYTSGPLLKSLIFDANVTDWFEREEIRNQNYFVKTYLVDNVFLSTHSGLTRWKTFTPQQFTDIDDDEGKVQKEVFRGNKSIDEDWYKRVVEDTFHRREDTFVYSVPFEISGYEYETLITSTSAVFLNVTDNKGKIQKYPVAALGVQFNYHSLSKRYQNITKSCAACKNVNCQNGLVSCFILDNNAYVILGSQLDYTGRFIGDISPIVTYHLLQNGVYKKIRMFDYQAICQKPPEKKDKNFATRPYSLFRRLLENLLQVTDWALVTILLLIRSVVAGPQYESNKNETLLYEKLEINKTVPTPCDKEMWLFTLGDHFLDMEYVNNTVKAGCDWYYVVERIPHSNLLFLAANPICEMDTVSYFQNNSQTPTPVEIDYTEPLACYINTYNNFSRRFYSQCYKNSPKENKLNENRAYCGHTWK